MKKIKVIFYGNGSGAEMWRFQDPSKYMAKSGKFEIKIPKGDMTWEDLMWADIIVVQGLVDKLRISMIYAAQQEYGKKLVVEFDDYFRVEKDSPFKMIHNIHKAPEMIQVTMKIADMVVTTTEYLAEKFRKLNDNVKVCPNFMDMDRWDLPTLPNDSNEIRIFWAGSMTHLNDLKESVWALKKIMKEYPNVKFVTMGDPRIKDYFEGYNVECMLGIHGDYYQKRLHGVRFDIGIAPLRNTGFNRCKSYIKPLEYGICKVPSVASDVEPYQHFEEGTVLIAKNKEEWYELLKRLIDNESYRKELGQKMYEYVKREFDLSKKINIFIDAYSSLV
jgi:O-antigen biosynthesis protein